MEKFVRLVAPACPLPAENIDTDQILRGIVAQDAVIESSGARIAELIVAVTEWRKSH